MSTHAVHAERLRVAEETKRVAAAYGFGPDVTVLSALQEALNASHAVMQFWQQRVRELQSLTESGIGGSTDVAAAIRAEERARRDLARVATDCARVGMEAKRAVIDRESAEAIVTVLRDAVGALGADPDHPDVRAALAAALRRVNQRGESGGDRRTAAAGPPSPSGSRFRRPPGSR